MYLCDVDLYRLEETCTLCKTGEVWASSRRQSARVRAVIDLLGSPATKRFVASNSLAVRSPTVSRYNADDRDDGFLRDICASFEVTSGSHYVACGATKNLRVDGHGIFCVGPFWDCSTRPTGLLSWTMRKCALSWPDFQNVFGPFDKETEKKIQNFPLEPLPLVLRVYLTKGQDTLKLFDGEAHSLQGVSSDDVEFSPNDHIPTKNALLYRHLRLGITLCIDDGELWIRAVGCGDIEFRRDAADDDDYGLSIDEAIHSWETPHLSCSNFLRYLRHDLPWKTAPG